VVNNVDINSALKEVRRYAEPNVSYHGQGTWIQVALDDRFHCGRTM
jgi:hypothetical protein